MTCSWSSLAGRAGCQIPFTSSCVTADSEISCIWWVTPRTRTCRHSTTQQESLPSRRFTKDFGFPVLEAMACGVPVVTSNLSSLPEVAGDAALLIDPYDGAALTDALERIVVDNDLRQRLVLAGHAQAGRFTWQRAARELLQVYQSLGAIA